MAKLVGIDASRYSTAERTGTENYSYHLINALAVSDHPGLSFRYYLNAGDASEYPQLSGLDKRAIPFPRLWTHARLSAEMVVRRPDLLFVPSHVIPAVHPRSVVTIHDLGYLHEPEAHPARQRQLLDWTTRWNARAATTIIAISTSTRDDLISRYAIDSEKIRVIWHGVGEEFRPQEPDRIASLRKRFDLPEKFILAVGTIQPRKNLGNLAQAVRRLREAGSPISLVTAGKRGWLAEQVEHRIRDALPGSAWRDLGYVPTPDLPALYGAATVVAMVSRFEGFGLPVLEAMACGAPVVVSDRGSLPEVAGDDALIADADDPGSISACIGTVLEDPGVRAKLVARGKTRAAVFTWQRAAQETIAVLAEAVSAHRG